MRTVTAPLALAAALLAAAPAHARPADPAVAKKILIDSVAIPTVEGRGKVPELAAYYAGVLKAAGFTDADIEITPMGETATFAATLKGSSDAKPILLLGHMDVVEADAKDWTRDPFVPVEENGYIFGRGSEDNKFDVAMMVATMAQLRKDGFQPKRSIILLLSGDEETAMLTTQALAAQYKGAEFALNGDGGGGLIGEDGKPKYYALQAGEKTYADFTLEVTNPGGHSSRPSDTNAIVQLANALAKVGAYRFQPQQNELTKVGMPIVADQVGGEIGAALKAFAADPADARAIAAIRADPEYVGQIGTTCVPTLVKGGHAENALPQRATANINCRIFPGVGIEAVRAELEKVIADPAVAVKSDPDATASDASPLRPDVVAAVTKAVHARAPGLPIIPSMSAGATDSLYFRAVGVPSYGVAGLFSKASDSFAHGLNERAPVAAIAPALAHWDSLLRDLSK
ncbi:M20/M25/M40 family metallo-hydrolase [Sphingopyxis panaciterrulae]|uniref:Acetylornithine deacetylase/succinyl-diaminopimelate desuccinylase-like protein n=1 Tax=Sphingopyxis panaciterrulae TaxID=462372 RepID=A0A7W9B3D8_9SPHN|nr:M20/M25/M40 family metallo-hydrolase [Sphingopyxis panaciterrulae]MBB5705506.1 acetylornithine deacetylase/succinyl-diaminopimelate desuccinylase-like protein [Sphingopyxis panaciterrulae]